MRIKRQLYLWHRYLGIALCLLIALWFASGVVMMYVPYPSLGEERRVAGLPELESGDYLPPEQVLADYPHAWGLRLNAASGEPAYMVATPEGQQLLDATTGELRTPGRDATREAARRHGGSDVARAFVRRVDQWTVTSNFDPHRPLRLMRLDDAAETWVYVSSATGEVVQETTRWQRGWNWVGAVVHWIYPWQLRQYPELWRNLVIALCVPALALVGTGIAVGAQRLRLRRRYKGNRTTPYQGWQRWHHLLGVGCAVFLVTFLVSGLLSLNPAGVFDPGAAATEARRSWSSGPLVTGDLVGPSERIDAREDVRELVWQRRAGRSLVLIRTPDGTETQSVRGGPPGFDSDSLVAWADAVVPDADMVASERLMAPDAYYHDRDDSRPLPVFRVRFNDAAATALYINPRTGALEAVVDRPHRWQRWLYSGLHTLDMRFLWQRRPLWDAVMLTLCLTGLSFSLTGILLGWRRLTRGGSSRHRQQPRRRRAVAR